LVTISEEFVERRRNSKLFVGSWNHAQVITTGYELAIPKNLDNETKYILILKIKRGKIENPVTNTTIEETFAETKFIGLKSNLKKNVINLNKGVPVMTE
jgi:hypothetical protein